MLIGKAFFWKPQGILVPGLPEKHGEIIQQGTPGDAIHNQMMGDNPEIGHPIFFHKTGADQQILVNAEVDGERVKRGICRPQMFSKCTIPFPNAHD